MCGTLHHGVDIAIENVVERMRTTCCQVSTDEYDAHRLKSGEKVETCSSSRVPYNQIMNQDGAHRSNLQQGQNARFHHVKPIGKCGLAHALRRIHNGRGSLAIYQ